MSERKKTITLGYTMLAGSSDTLTGLGLILLPALTLKMMGVDADAYQASLVRFIGAFVAATGSLYLVALTTRCKPDFWTRMKTVWIATAWIRTWVAAVTIWMIMTGTLSASWLPVPVTDSVLAAFQLFWILKKQFPENG